MYNKLILSALMSGCVLSSAAADVDFTYNTAGEDAVVYGFDKKETYDVAIKIADPSCFGASVKGFTVDLPVNSSAITDISGWMSTELRLENKKNAPDIATKSAAVAEGVLDVTFDEPYMITTSGVWVGYSFTITDLTKQNEYDWPGSPIAVVETDNNLDNGLWVHSSRSRLKWTDLGNSLGAVSPMVVHLSTDFGPYDVTVAVPAQSYMVNGKNFGVPITVVNHGTAPLEDITYSYSIGELKSEGSIHLESPIPASGTSQVVEFPVGPVEKTGEYPFSLTVLTSNGQENNDPLREGSGNMNVWPVIPVNRPLVEEFTGLGCGYCPRGYVAMEYMHDTLGDMFVGMAYHSFNFEGGCMATVKDTDFPVYVSGFPSADFNRQDMMDPSYLPGRWSKYATDMVPAAIDLDMKWEDDAKSKALLTSSLTFVKDIENADYKLAFALVADGLKNDKWEQSNYYSGEDEGEGVDSPLWDLFLGDAPSKVTGLTFNDVVVYFKEIKGIEGSVPATIKEGETMTYEYRVDLADVKNLLGEYFINKGATLHGVVILLDGETGYSVNCNKSESLAYEYNPPLAVSEIGTDGKIVASEYHDLHGMKVTEPASGILVRTDIMSDGTRRTSKVVVK